MLFFKYVYSTLYGFVTQVRSQISDRISVGMKLRCAFSQPVRLNPIYVGFTVAYAA